MSKKRRRRRRLHPILAYPLWVLMAPYHLLVWLYYQTVGRFIHGVRRRQKKGQSRLGAVLRLLGDLALFPFNLLLSFLWMVVVEWTASRQARLFLQGLPAVVIGLGTVGAILFSEYYPQDSRVRRYERYAIEAVRDEKYDEARICYEKLAVIKEGEDEYPYRVAALLFEEGDESRAIGIMQSLAPLDKSKPAGFAPAHLWLWRHLMKQENVTPAMVQAAEMHVERALESEGDDPNTQLIYSRMKVRRGEFAKALPYLEDLSEEDPQIRMEYAEALRGASKVSGDSRNEEAALRQIIIAQGDLEQLIRDSPTNIAAWVRLHQCLLFRHEYQAALQVLEQARLATGNEDFRRAQSRVCVLWSNYLIEQEGLADRLDEIVTLLDRALALAPNDPAALSLLVSVVNSPEIENDEAIKMLQTKLADTKAPAMVHFLLGSKFAMANNFDQAIFHFERARKLSPQTAAVLNNMAWVLANMPRKDDETEEQVKARYEQALDLINQAIEGDADVVNYYDTRGQIYVKLGMYKEALDDLELAIPSKSDKNALFHEALAECYENLDQPDLAKINREKAEEIRKRSETSPTN